MVDELTNLNFTSFFSTRNGIIDPNLERIEKWNNNGLVVKHMRLDNSCENKKLHEQAESKDLKMNIYFEYTVRDTPQQNYLEELRFLVIAKKGEHLCIVKNTQ